MNGYRRKAKEIVLDPLHCSVDKEFSRVNITNYTNEETLRMATHDAMAGTQSTSNRHVTVYVGLSMHGLSSQGQQAQQPWWTGSAAMVDRLSSHGYHLSSHCQAIY